ncbi:MAG: SusC/RagA family TonB-linked outer membrane protein [Marinoscillum sp.]
MKVLHDFMLMSIVYKLKESGFFLLMLLMCVSGFSQSTNVTGRVISSDDSEPLPGVTVLLKGTSVGTITDMDGQFAINASGEDILSFSFVGFESKEVQVKGQTVVNVSLELDIQSLNEVVVMGYSSKSQKELSASVVTLDSKSLQNVTAPRVETMLQGKVPGLIVSSPTGQPGQPADIRIRGITSLNIDRPPLFVVDGMVGGNFVPNDIETVTVLKDAAAIGLYGAAGAAGVIVITTKQAQKGKSEINVSSRVGLKEAVTGNFQMMNSEQLYAAQKSMWGEANLVSFLNNRPESLEDQNFDWMDAGFRRAMIQNHNVSMRGAEENISYTFSIDYFNEEGTFINTDFQRLNLRGGIKFSPSKNFSVNTDVNVQVNEDHINHYSWFEDVFWNTPWDSPTHTENGMDVTSGPQYVTNPSNEWIGQFKRNFIHSAKYNQLGSTGQDVVWSTRTTLRLTDWLNLETRTRLNSFNSLYKEYYAANTDQGISQDGVITNIRNQGWGVLSTHFLRFSQEIGDHDIGAFVAHEGGYSQNRFADVTGINLSTPSIDVLDGASVIQSAGGYDVESTGISFITEVSYGFKKKYFATAYWRADGSSVFAENNRIGYFPGASFAWLISDETFLQGLSSVDLLKFRASYGLTGNSNIDNFLSLPTYNITRQYNGQPGAEPNNPANPNLSWETTKMFNLGVDFGLWNSLTINLDLYEKKVEGMLLRNPLAFSSGYEQRTENIGDMVNRGLEFSVSYSKSFGQLRYTGNFNFAYNHNEITKISDLLDQQTVVAGAIQQVNAVGSKAFTWYMPRWLGVNPENGSPQWEVVNYDANGNETNRSVTEIYAEATSQPIESALPDYTGGFSSSFSYKGFSLSFLLTFQQGNHIYHYTRQFVDSDGANTGINLMQLHEGWSRWENPGDQATHPVLKRGGSNGAHNTSSRFIEKGDFLRLRNVQLAYSFPANLIEWSGVKDATISLSADNMLTFSNFSGMDPDVGLQVQEFSLPGMSYLKYPISKQVLVALNLKF